MRRLALASITLALAACAMPTRPTLSSEAMPARRVLAFQEVPSEPYGIATVTRDSGLLGGGCATGVSVDGTLAAVLERGQTAAFKLAAGKHILSGVAYGEGLCNSNFQQRIRADQEIFIEAGKASAYRVAINQGIQIMAMPVTQASPTP